MNKRPIFILGLMGSAIGIAVSRMIQEVDVPYYIVIVLILSVFWLIYTGE